MRFTFRNVFFMLCFTLLFAGYFILEDSHKRQALQVSASASDDEQFPEKNCSQLASRYHFEPADARACKEYHNSEIAAWERLAEISITPEDNNDLGVLCRDFHDAVRIGSWVQSTSAQLLPRGNTTRDEAVEAVRSRTIWYGEAITRKLWLTHQDVSVDCLGTQFPGNPIFGDEERLGLSGVAELDQALQAWRLYRQKGLEDLDRPPGFANVAQLAAIEHAKR